MSAELEDAQGFGPVPKGWYSCEITEKEDETTSKTNAPMIAITLTINAGELKNKRVFPPYRVMAGGVTEKGDRHNLGRLCELINATGIEWKCGGCSASGARKFVKTEDNKYVCPDCGKSARFVYDTDHFVGKSIKALLDQEKGFNSEEMVNRVSRLAPLS
jgi:hypothetical protein